MIDTKTITTFILCTLSGWTMSQNFVSTFDAQIIGDQMSIERLVVDSKNNILLSGKARGEIDLDPGSSTHSTPDWSYDDVFIAKYDEDYNFIWSISLDGNAFYDVRGLASDSSGNVYIAGSFTGTLDFDPDGPGLERTSFGSTQAFLAKYDSTGLINWVHQFGNTTWSQWPIDLLIDDDKLTMSIVFTGEVDFDPGSAEVILSGNSSEAILELDLDGGFEWVGLYGQSSSLNGICKDTEGNLYTYGSFRQSLDFDFQGTANIMTSGLGSDAFLAKYNLQHELLWVQTFGDSWGDDEVRKIAVNDNGKILMVSYSEDEHQIGDTPIQPGITIAILTEEGDLQLSQGASVSTIREAIPRNQNEFILMSSFEDTFDLDSMDALPPLTPISEKENYFILQLSDSLKTLGLTQFSATAIIDAEITVNRNSDIVLVQSFSGSGQLIPGSESESVANGETNIILQRITPGIIDADQDGFGLLEDCDDNNAAINPGIEEIPNNGIDENCDGRDLTTNTNDAQQRSIIVTPNPARNFIQVKSKTDKDKSKFNLELRDVHGRIVKRQDQSQGMEILGLQPGIYFLTIYTAKSLSIQKPILIIP